MTTRFYTFALIFFVAFAAGCSSSGSNATEHDATGLDATDHAPTACSATAASIQANVFKASCDGAACHGSQNPAAGLNLVDTLPEQLMGKHGHADAQGWPGIGAKTARLDQQLGLLGGA